MNRVPYLATQVTEFGRNIIPIKALSSHSFRYLYMYACMHIQASIILIIVKNKCHTCRKKRQTQTT